MRVNKLKPDLDTSQRIEQFVRAFYGRLLNDERLAPIFLDIAAIDIKVHLPLICSYWEKLLLGNAEYKRHTMNIHRQLHAKQPLTKQDFNRWLELFISTVEEMFRGEKAEQAKRIAGQIAANMFSSISSSH